MFVREQLSGSTGTTLHARPRRSRKECRRVEGELGARCRVARRADLRTRSYVFFAFWFAKTSSDADGGPAHAAPRAGGAAAGGESTGRSTRAGGGARARFWRAGAGGAGRCRWVAGRTAGPGFFLRPWLLGYHPPSASPGFSTAAPEPLGSKTPATPRHLHITTVKQTPAGAASGATQSRSGLAWSD